MKYVKQIDLQCEKHKVEIINIISGRKSLMRQSADMSCKAVDKYNNFIKYNSILFGYYDDEKLISFLTSTPWEGLPYYTISNFFVLQGHIRYFTLTNSGMIDLLTETVKYMENKNYYTFYYVRSEDHWPIKNEKRKNMGFSKQWPEYKKYVVTMEEMIEPGQRSRYNTHDILLGGVNTSDLRRVIVRYTLPHELRSEGYDFYELQ
jgi:hypothetical protein